MSWGTLEMPCYQNEVARKEWNKNTHTIVMSEDKYNRIRFDLIHHTVNRLKKPKDVLIMTYFFFDSEKAKKLEQALDKGLSTIDLIFGKKLPVTPDSEMYGKEWAELYEDS